MTTYVCKGSVRGCCGHKHRTISGGVSCLKRDQSACRSQGGYSDRSIYRLVDGQIEELSENEYYDVSDRLINK